MLNKEQELLLELLMKKYGKQHAENIKATKITITQQKKRRAQLSSKRWTFEDLQILALMHSQGRSTTIIARRLRRSKQAVQTMTSHMFGENKKQVAIVKQYWQKYGYVEQNKLV
jgi:DNA-binding NarL/FixJ family response regulator